MAKIELRAKFYLPTRVYNSIPMLYSFLTGVGAFLFSVDENVWAGVAATIAGWRALQILHLRGHL